MPVRDVMRTEVTVAHPGDKLSAAMRLLTPRGVRHLPVVDVGELVGIGSDRDLKSAMASAEGATTRFASPGAGETEHGTTLASEAMTSNVREEETVCTSTS
jgi:CBS domain-containing protein